MDFLAIIGTGRAVSKLVLPDEQARYPDGLRGLIHISRQRDVLTEIELANRFNGFKFESR